MKRVIESASFNKIVERLASEFHREVTGALRLDPAGGAVVGIQTRGVHVGKRIAAHLKKKFRFAPPVGSLDITLYRDDVGEIGNQPTVKETDIPFEVDGKAILLVDDVLHTGRTIRAALDALLELGRPRLIRLAVVVDRGGRELPVQPDYCGTAMRVGRDEQIQIKVKEIDGADGVWVVPVPRRAAS